MTPTSSYNNSQGIVQPGWRDRRPFRQSLASRPRILLELFSPKALKEEVEVEVVAEVVGRKGGEGGGLSRLRLPKDGIVGSLPTDMTWQRPEESEG